MWLHGNICCTQSSPKIECIAITPDIFHFEWIPGRKHFEKNPPKEEIHRWKGCSICAVVSSKTSLDSWMHCCLLKCSLQFFLLCTSSNFHLPFYPITVFVPVTKWNPSHLSLSRRTPQVHPSPWLPRSLRSSTWVWGALSLRTRQLIKWVFFFVHVHIRDSTPTPWNTSFCCHVLILWSVHPSGWLNGGIHPLEAHHSSLRISSQVDIGPL